jgi:hypothetical protein
MAAPTAVQMGLVVAVGALVGWAFHCGAEIIVDALAGTEPIPHRHRTVRHARRWAMKPAPSQTEGEVR